MDIIINQANLPKIQAAIDSEQRLARVRRLTADDVVIAARRATSHLWAYCTKKAMTGSVVSVDVFAQNFARAYNGIPESTQFAMQFDGKHWRLVAVYRKQCRGAARAYLYTLTEECQKSLLAGFTKIGV